MSKPVLAAVVCMVLGGLVLMVGPQGGGGKPAPTPEPAPTEPRYIDDAWGRWCWAMRSEIAKNFREVGRKNPGDSAAAKLFNKLHDASKKATGGEVQQGFGSAIDGGPDAMFALADAIEGKP